jgi:hypothetical protein
MTAISAGPVVANSFSETLPPTVGAVFGTMTATNLPTSWAITNGNWNGYYAINNSGGISGQSPALASVTNLLLQSQNFETTWNLTPPGGSGTAAIGTAATTAPDGSNTGELMGEDTATAKHGILQSVAGSASTTYTLSVYAKAQTRTRVLLEIDDAAITNGAYVVFDLAGNQIGDPGGSFGSGWTKTNATITDVGAGWRRCTLTVTSGGTTIGAQIRADGGAGTAAQVYSYAGGGPGVGLYLWGAQLEQASSAGPYVPTTAASASHAGQPPGTYTLTVQATNAAGSGSGTATITAAGAPVINPASFNFKTPRTTGYTIGTLTATGSPTSWAITGGDSANLFAISNTGVLTTRQAVSGGGSETLSITATNANGTSAPASVAINWSASAGVVAAPVSIGGGGYVTRLQMANDGTMVIGIDVFNGYVGHTNDPVGTPWRQLFTPANAPPSMWGFANGVNGGLFVGGQGHGIYDVTICANNSNVIYASWFGRILVSTDQAQTWALTTLTFNYSDDANASDITRLRQKKLMVDPNNAARCLIGTPSNGVYMTTNGTSGASATFTQLAGISAGARNAIGAIAYDASSLSGGASQTAYIGVSGVGIYRTQNAGASWSLLPGSPTGAMNDAFCAGGKYYVSAGTNVYQFDGSTWANFGTGGNQWGVYPIAMQPGNNTHIMGFGNAGAYPNFGTISGNTCTWDNLHSSSTVNPNVPPSDVGWMANLSQPGDIRGGTYNYVAVGGAFDPLVANRFWFCFGYGVAYIDIGSTWPMPAGIHSVVTKIKGAELMVARDIASIPEYPYPVVAVEDQGIFQITDPTTPPRFGCAQIITRASNNSCWSMDWSQSVLGVLAAQCSGYYVNNRTFGAGYSTNGGATWTQFPTFPWTTNQTPESGMITCINANIFVAIRAGDANGPVKRNPVYTLNHGTTWQNCTGAPAGIYQNYLYARSPTLCNDAAGYIYIYDAGMAGSPGTGLWKSTQAGANFNGAFTQVDASITPNNNCWSGSMKTVPGNPSYLFITYGYSGGVTYPGNHSFYKRTSDTGGWVAVPNVSDVFTFGFGKAYPGYTFPTLWLLGFVNAGGAGYKYGLWRSRDLGVSDWTYISDGFFGHVDQPSCMSGDMNDTSKVYVGYGGSSFRYMSGIT